jgi:hypothetical protein
MKNTIQVYDKPQVMVRISNLVINPETKKFSLTLGTKPLNKRVKKFQEEHIEGLIKIDLREFLTVRFDDKIKTVANNEAGFEWTKTGTKSTRFQRWCKAHGYPCFTGVLQTMVFECENNSSDPGHNPFKLVMNADGMNVLSLVRTASAVSKSTVNPDTGEITDSYTKRYYKANDGIWKESFVSPSNYLRLIRSVEQEVEVYQEA